MQRDFRGNTLGEAIHKALARPSDQFIDTKNVMGRRRQRAGLGRPSPEVQRIEREIERRRQAILRELQSMERLTDEVERRVKQLGTRGGDAMLELGINLAFVGGSLLALRAAIAAAQTAVTAAAAASASFHALDMAREVENTFSQLKAIEELIKIGSIRTRVQRSVLSIGRHRTALRFLLRDLEAAKRDENH